jgi:hypothetical protein
MSVAPAIAANRPGGGGSALRPLLCLLAALDTALGAFAVAAPHAFYRQVRGPRMRLPNSAHTSRPWRIHELTRDFRLEDVWALSTPGGTDDFPRLVQLIASFDPSRSSSGYGAADAPRAVAGGSARRPIRPAHAPLHLPVPHRGRVGGGGRQPHRARGHAPRLGPGRGGRLPRPDGSSREAKRTSREWLHGRYQAIPAPGGVPADDARAGAALAGARRRSDNRARP